MRLSVQGLAVAASLLWGGALLCVGLTNLASPLYGMSFLQVMSSVYPFFHASRTIVWRQLFLLVNDDYFSRYG